MHIPFELTESQKHVHEVIVNDMARETPMQRLLQGDVGSGKTLVALRAMLLTVDSEKQAVLLVPTEVLASQHHSSIVTILGELAQLGIRNPENKKVRVLLLTGSQKQREKDAIIADMRSGEADIVIGTHALLYHRDDLRNLGLVVIDEQHRFGVGQRDVLRSASNGIVPHLLVMTATPIPRSVAMLLFSDLEISTLYDMPAKKARTETFVIDSSDVRYTDRMWARIREEVDAGRNVFIVVPRIDDADLFDEDEEGNDDEHIIARDIFAKLANAGLTERITKTSISIMKMRKFLEEEEHLSKVPVGILHGRMNAQEKDTAMNDFVSMRTPILLATTVVEVGIDVPNATAMVIADADKFGISTLHQLRGRIGRGEHKSVCFLPRLVLLIVLRKVLVSDLNGLPQLPTAQMISNWRKWT